MHSPQFVTVFHAIWEPGTGRLVYSNAGHIISALEVAVQHHVCDIEPFGDMMVVVKRV